MASVPFFLAQWKTAPLNAKLEVLTEYWESETHYWRKKCWWLSDRIAQERDRQVIYAAMKAAAGTTRILLLERDWALRVRLSAP